MEEKNMFLYIFKLCSILMIITITTPVFAAQLVVGEGESYTNIQAAVDAASEGDVVLIKPNTDPKGWRENIVINTNNITLRGDADAAEANLDDQVCPDVYLDGCETPDKFSSCGAVVITINGYGVTIERIFLRHGSIRFNETADNSTLKESCISGDYSSPVHSRGSSLTNVTISSNVFQGGDGDSIYLSGDNHVVMNNQFFSVDNGIEISGDGCRIVNNCIYSNEDEAIDLKGDNGVIENNLILGGEDGIEYDGNNPTITGNVIEDMDDDSLNVDCKTSCTGGLIENNRIIGSTDGEQGLEISNGKNMIIRNNHFSLVSDKALYVKGSNCKIQNNTLIRNGGDNEASAMSIQGDNNEIENNVVKYNAASGIETQGDGNSYTNNTVFGNGQAGIMISFSDTSDTVFNGNTIKNNHGEGIANGGVNTIITDNTITGNRTDVCSDDGSISSFTGNTFTTGGTDTGCVVNIMTIP
ncbi:MAG: hypothetical protein OMM_02596 [Candidatus Magnetoglobus multicellularis str. Araruama]|uniref:Right handed beta helix domain-containing protein n=1 Tax=Candidatus Magnetoglobus multicellularis str. Araruama TaxID=890399 RepID=A0A1V1P915_9BACT|nr:MAG: hypothetical protein OMM_02596 [Candidatus Magnetoglobus multicellularis str. Araruama]